jgi:hypothetical protein
MEGSVSLIRNMRCESADYLLRPGNHGMPPTIFELIMFGFTCMTIPLHILVLIIIVVEIRSNNRVNNSFYLICLSIGVVDVICLINSCTFYSWPRWGWFRTAFVRTETISLRSGFFISWGLGLSQVSF